VQAKSTGAQGQKIEQGILASKSVGEHGSQHRQVFRDAARTDDLKVVDSHGVAEQGQAGENIGQQATKQSDQDGAGQVGAAEGAR